MFDHFGFNHVCTKDDTEMAIRAVNPAIPSAFPDEVIRTELVGYDVRVGR